MKAQFKMTMITPKEFTSVLFNTKAISNNTFSGNATWTVTVFNTTVPMSSYLVAFVVSNFEMVSGLTPVYGKEVGVAARPAPIQHGDGDYALNVTAVIIDYYADYFNVPYPLESSSQKFYL